MRVVQIFKSGEAKWRAEAYRIGPFYEVLEYLLVDVQFS